LITSIQPDVCVIGGDCNVDFSRNNAHSNALANALNDVELTLVRNDVSLTYERNGRVSQIDHFFVSTHVTVTAFDVLSSATNPSDHCPIFTSLDLQLPISLQPQRHLKSTYNVTSIGLDRLHDHCERIFSNASPICCVDTNCCDPDHLAEIENAFLFCHDSILDGCSNFFSRTTTSERAVSWRQHWTEYHTSLRDSSLWWHWLWATSNKPLVGVVYENMKSTKLIYHRAIKQLKADYEETKMKQLLHLTNDSRRFFKKVKEFNGPQQNISVTVNGKCGAAAANEFADDATKCPIPAADPEQDLLFSHRMAQCESNPEHLFTVNDIASAVYKLRPSTIDPNGISSTVLKHLGPNFISYLTSILNSLIIHGINPRILSKSVLTPLLKANKRAVSNVSSYRLIASVPVFLKVFDYAVLNKYQHCLHTNMRQFGYKKGHSPAIANLLVKETINHYVSNNSPVYGCFLDASKAFDCVNRTKLFNTLLDRGIPPVIVRFYHVLYSEQVNCIKWDGCFSAFFILRMGVLQGGVASPVFFSVYIDDLHLILERNGYGCWIGSIYLGLIAYADDHVLLMPTLRALENALSLILASAAALNITFNPSKSALIKFTRSAFQPRTISLCGHVFEYKKKVEYLGNIIEYNLSDGESIARLRNNIIWKGSAIIQGLRFCHPRSIAKVFLAKCLDLYGSDCIVIKRNIFKRVETAFNNVLRKCFRLHYRTHVNILCSLINLDRLQHVLLRRSISLVERFSKCNFITSYVYNFFIHNSQSIISNNLWSARHILANDPSRSTSSYQSLIEELIEIRAGGLYVSSFSRTDMSLVLDYLTTS
jgi:hypothetical protein